MLQRWVRCMFKTRKNILLIVLGLPLAIVGFHFFILFIYPIAAVTEPIIFGVALIIAFILWESIPDLVLRLSSKKKREINEQQRLRNRNNMIQLVWNTWIEGVQKKSLYNEVLIDLGMETKPDTFERPWEIVMQMPDQELKRVAPGTTILELFDQSNHSLLILGEPGSGKTTMLLDLAFQAIERTKAEIVQTIPVIVNLSSWTYKQTIKEWLVEEIATNYDTSKKIARRWIDSNELLLILDGLDEIEINNREACIEAINSFREMHFSPLAVCSRIVDYQSITHNLKQLGAIVLQPLTPKQIDEYFKHTGIELEFLHQAWKVDANIQELARTPLMLCTMTLTYQGSLEKNPERPRMADMSRIYIFDAYIQRMFDKKITDRQYPNARAIHWLAWLAKEMTKHNQSIFSPEMLRRNWLPAGKQRFLHNLLSSLLMVPLVGILSGIFNLPAIWLGVFDQYTREIHTYGPKLQQLLNFLFQAFPYYGILSGLLFGLMFFLLGILPDSLVFGWLDFERSSPARKIHWSWPGARRGAIIGLIIALLFSVLFTIYSFITTPKGLLYPIDLIPGIIDLIKGLWFWFWIVVIPCVLIGGSVFGLSGADEIGTQTRSEQRIWSSFLIHFGWD